MSIQEDKTIMRAETFWIILFLCLAHIVAAGSVMLSHSCVPEQSTTVEDSNGN